MFSEIGLRRAISVLSGPNELGHFLFTCLVFTFVFGFYSIELKAKHRKKLIFISVVMLTALFFSMSRSSIIAFTYSLLAITLLRKGKGRTRPILVGISGLVILSLILPYSLKDLFAPAYTFSDPYFQGIKWEYLWNTFWQSPLLGQGFSATESSASKLGIAEVGATWVGATDNSFLQISMQIGLIGFFLHFLIWFLFLKNAYVAVKNIALAEKYRLVSIAIFGILVGLMVGSLHTSPWNYVSLAGTYWILGAICTFCYQEAKKAKGQ